MDLAASGLGTESLWSFTPKRSVVADLPKLETSHLPLNALVTGPGVIGHVLETIAQADRPVNLYILYSSVEALTRELLLLSIAFDHDVSIEERSEMFLEIFANVNIREKSFNYLKQISKSVQRFVQRSADQTLSNYADLSNLKFKNLDEIDQCVAFICSQQECDIGLLREHRLRAFYGERYDVRLNLIDWDYIMNLKQVASIIHKLHFTEWRMIGQAFEVREAKYTVPNRTLLSYRNGKKKSSMSSVKVLGYWGDVAVCPYITFGIEANERPDLFEQCNDQHKHSACEISRYNVQRLFNAMSLVLSNVKVVPIMDLNKSKFQHMFDCVLMPLQSQLRMQDLNQFLRPGSRVLIETLKFVSCLQDKKRKEFENKIKDLAKEQGWLEKIQTGETESQEIQDREYLQAYLEFFVK